MASRRDSLLPEPNTHEYVKILLAHSTHDAGELAARVAMTLYGQGRTVYSWNVLRVDELLPVWNPASLASFVTVTHYGQPQSIPFDAVQIRRARYTGRRPNPTAAFKMFAPSQVFDAGVAYLNRVGHHHARLDIALTRP
jgi:hypothetical protein